jgi:hypothetical protein
MVVVSYIHLQFGKTHFSWSQVAKEQESAKDPREKEKVGDETVPNDFTTYVLRPEK